MDRAEINRQFMSAVGVLPERLWKAAYTLQEEDRLLCEELRIRTGRDMTALCNGRCIRLTENEHVTADELEELIARATNSSIHAYNGQMQKGFLTIGKGHRLGLCGEICPDNGTLKAFSSCNLRIAREVPNVALPLLQCICENGLENTLIVAPPGGGKTTFLRDSIRLLSERYTICLADERMEVAACQNGQPRFNIGECDVISGGIKAKTIDMLLRSMSPQIIALDEITAIQDVEAIELASYTGCRFIATAHSGAIEDLCKRPIYKKMLEQGIFSTFVCIENIGKQRKYRVYKLKGVDNNAKTCGSHDDCNFLFSYRLFHEWNA